MHAQSVTPPFKAQETAKSKANVVSYGKRKRARECEGDGAHIRVDNEGSGATEGRIGGMKRIANGKGEENRRVSTMEHWTRTQDLHLVEAVQEVAGEFWTLVARRFEEKGEQSCVMGLEEFEKRWREL